MMVSSFHHPSIARVEGCVGDMINAQPPTQDGTHLRSELSDVVRCDMGRNTELADPTSDEGAHRRFSLQVLD
jgi:hypothetical protein